MGYFKPKNSQDVKHVIWSMVHEATDSRNDGFTTWPIKQELYELKWAIEEALERCSVYSVEPEWLEEQEQQREKDKMWKILKDK
jgi:hypothetical protein